MKNGSSSGGFTPPPRPDWVQRIIDEGSHMDIRSLVPLEAEELMATARRNTGFSDFGGGKWEEGFRVFLRSLEQDAELQRRLDPLVRHGLQDEKVKELMLQEVLHIATGGAPPGR